MGILAINNIKSIGGIPVSVAAIEQAVLQVNQPPTPAIHKQYYLAADFVAVAGIAAFHTITGAIVQPTNAPSSALSGFTYDPITGVHTCTEAGLYLINANISTIGDANNQLYYTELRVNTVRVSAVSSMHRQVRAAHSVSTIVYMAVGDTYSYATHAGVGETKFVIGDTVIPAANYYSTFSHVRLSL